MDGVGLGGSVHLLPAVARKDAQVPQPHEGHEGGASGAPEPQHMRRPGFHKLAAPKLDADEDLGHNAREQQPHEDAHLGGGVARRVDVLVPLKGGGRGHGEPDDEADGVDWVGGRDPEQVLQEEGQDLAREVHDAEREALQQPRWARHHRPLHVVEAVRRELPQAALELPSERLLLPEAGPVVLLALQVLDDLHAQEDSDVVTDEDI
mmetsp:Transcript_41008/g.103919  ORF Transcript_41008/g.103919 Transcript_41008/m.103919 type:complete len:207 (+) Transcript_41008:209-829(+)